MSKTDQSGNGGLLSDGDDQIDAADPGVNRQKEAEARKFAILQLLCDRAGGDVSFDEARTSLNRRFPGGPKTDDLPQLLSLLGGRTLVQKDRNTFSVQPVDLFVDQGYGAGTDAKKAIADLIVEDFFGRKNEVVYLSTGTTVYEVSRSLVDAIENGKKDIRIILTDNLAIVDLFCRRARSSARLQKVELVILGGTAKFGDGDIALETTFAQLTQWEYSTAIVSATKVNPWTGMICSFRQPETKKKFFTDVVVGQLIIPVESSKIESKDEGGGGGYIVHDPSTAALRNNKKFSVVTERLDAEIAEQLGKWYDVRVAERFLQKLR
jgi:DeoR/GlpR family transcriptional regulator of sugar metabolism